jgi:hypothetical protein
MLAYLYGGVAFTPTPNYYVALFTVNPTNAGGGTEVPFTGTGYTRAPVPNNLARWQTSGSSPTQATNIVTVSFPPATIDWGTITGIATMDAPTGGNMYNWSPVTPSKAVYQGDIATFGPGTIVVTQG